MAIGLHASKVLRNVTVGTSATDIPHGMPFTPIVLAVVVRHASAAASISVISVDATNVRAIASSAGVTADIWLVAPPA